MHDFTQMNHEIVVWVSDLMHLERPHGATTHPTPAPLCWEGGPPGGHLVPPGHCLVVGSAVVAVK